MLPFYRQHYYSISKLETRTKTHQQLGTHQSPFFPTTTTTLHPEAVVLFPTTNRAAVVGGSQRLIPVPPLPPIAMGGGELTKGSGYEV